MQFDLSEKPRAQNLIFDQHINDYFKVILIIG